jgi:hypothetical protein
LRPDVSADPSAASGQALDVTGFGRWTWILAFACVVTSAGCWQEVPYDPATRPPRQSSNAHPAETQAAPADDIFGGNESETPPSDSTAVDAGPAAPIEPAGSAAPPTSEAPPKPAVTDAERLAAWNLASHWALAAAYAGRGRPAAEYATHLNQASAAAQELGIVLPTLPAPPDSGKLAADMATALRASAGAELANAIGNRLDAAAAGAARLAITSHVLLLVYTPLEPDAPALAREIREAGIASKLPPELWQPLVDLVTRRSEYEAVKTAVLALPKTVGKHYSDAAAGGL